MAFQIEEHFGPGSQKGTIEKHIQLVSIPSFFPLILCTPVNV